MKVPILSGNVAIAKHRCWHAYDAWRRIDWIINVVIKTFALNKNGDDLSIAYNIIKPRSSASWKCNGPRFIFTRPYRRLIRLRLFRLYEAGSDPLPIYIKMLPDREEFEQMENSEENGEGTSQQT